MGGAMWSYAQATGRRLTGLFRRRRTWQALASFSLLAAPVSVLAWQAGSASPNGGRTASPSELILQQSSADSADSSDDAMPSAKQPADQGSGDGQPVSSSQATNHQHITVNTQTSHSSSSGTSSSVTVNGKQQHLSPNGELHKTYRTGSGTTDLDISVNHDQGGASGGNSSSSSTVNLNIQSDN